MVLYCAHVHDGPTFIGLGAQRAGTSWLYAVLRTRPGVWLPPIKELHYWDWADPEMRWPSLRWKRHLRLRVRSNAASIPGLGRLAHHPGRPVPGFDRRYFVGRRTPAWYRELFAAAPAGAVTGEITPSYWRMSSSGIEQLHRGLPRVRLVLVLRDPVARAWSAAVKQVARDRNRAVAEVRDDEWAAWVARFGALDYAAPVRRWRSVFPAEQLHIGWFDELEHDPDRFLARIVRHIGAEPDAASRGRSAAEPVATRPAVNPAATGHPVPEVFGRALASRVVADLDALRQEVDDPTWVDRWAANARALA